MPRRSAASVSVMQISESPPEPPPSLSPEAAAAWRDVVSSFRPSWFQGSEAVLASYSQVIALERQLAGMLPHAGVGSREWRRLIKLYLGVCGSLVSTATKLRITPQSTRTAKNAKLAPRGPMPWADDFDREPVPS
jgi:hypothetical protein